MFDSIKNSINGRLDAFVRTIHNTSFFTKTYHPYFFFSDLGLVCGIVVAYFFTLKFSQISFTKFLIVVACEQGIYWTYLKIKKIVFGKANRSLLQDSILVLLPTYIFLNYIAGHPIPASLDLFALFLSVYFIFARLGCFTSGCCYGKPSQLGVQYPIYVFKNHQGCRPFSSGAPTHERLIPVQLYEATGQFLLFCYLVFRINQGHRADGSSLLFFGIVYSGLRFMIDFLRQSSARPRIGILSEAQVVSVAVIGICLVIFIYI